MAFSVDAHSELSKVESSFGLMISNLFKDMFLPQEQMILSGIFLWHDLSDIRNILKLKHCVSELKMTKQKTDWTVRAGIYLEIINESKDFEMHKKKGYEESMLCILRSLTNNIPAKNKNVDELKKIKNFVFNLVSFSSVSSIPSVISSRDVNMTHSMIPSYFASKGRKCQGRMLIAR